MKNTDLAKRADLALADMTSNGGLLLPDQANTFIDMVVEQPTVIRQARVERLKSTSQKINRLGIGQRIFKAAPQGTPPYAADDGTNDRYLAAADRSKPTTSQIEISTKEVIAELHIPYESLEDNIEGASFEAHLMRLIAEQAALDFEEYGLWSDTLSGDAYLALQDGWMKRMASGNVVDNASAGISPDLFESGLLAMPQKYLRNASQMRHFISKANEIRYRARVAKRATGAGDSALASGVNDPLGAYGTQIVPADLLSQYGGAMGFFTYPKNLIFGIWRDIKVETDKDIRARQLIIVLTARIGVQIDDVAATVKYINI